MGCLPLALADGQYNRMKSRAGLEAKLCAHQYYLDLSGRAADPGAEHGSADAGRAQAVGTGAGNAARGVIVKPLGINRSGFISCAGEG